VDMEWKKQEANPIWLIKKKYFFLILLFDIKLLNIILHNFFIISYPKSRDNQVNSSFSIIIFFSVVFLLSLLEN